MRFCKLCGIELAIMLVLLASFLFIDVDLPQWEPAVNKSGQDAREIAAALSTPPTHLHSSFWKRIYHWQTLIGGILAVIGGSVAVFAAYIGAKALKEQTDETTKATREAASIQASAIIRQAEQASSELTRQINWEEDRRNREELKVKVQLASAFAGEIRALGRVIDFRDLITLCNDAEEKASVGLVKKQYISYQWEDIYYI